jgi:hypothetical protein
VTSTDRTVPPANTFPPPGFRLFWAGEAVSAFGKR